MQTIADVRRQNLVAVIESHYGGVAARLARKLNSKKTVLWRVTANTKSRQNMGDKLARRIEAVSGLPPGWMDTIHTPIAAQSGDYETELAAQIRLLPDSDKQMIEMLVAHAIRRLNQPT